MSQSRVTNLLRSLADWAERPANERQLRLDQETQLQQALADPAQRTRTAVAAWMLGTWWLGRGLARVQRGESHGFDDARLGQALRRCALLVRVQQATVQHGRPGPAFAPLQGAQCIVAGLALDDPGAGPLHDHFEQLPDAAFGTGDAFPLFVRALLVLRAGGRAVITPRLGPYLEVLQHWHGDQALLARKLAQLLDHHLERTHGAGAEFADPPLQAYPAEVLAVQNVRALLGLPCPKVEHPLLFTNLGQMQPQGPWPQDELLRRLERIVGRR